ncbi:MAG: AsmA family protein [Elusimicrobiaceae bacterium]|nr:AsmA family protein [Elusimicrobiaceae bacterium]
MKRIWIKRLLIAGACILIGVIGLHFLLKAVSGSAWMQQKIVDKLTAATGREVRLGDVRLHLLGVNITDFALAQDGGFEQGVMFQVNRLHLRWALLHLLHGQLHVKAAHIDGIVLHLVRDEQGKLNADLNGAETTPNTQKEGASFSLPLDVSVTEFLIRKLTVSYTDKAADWKIGFNNAELLLRNFKLDKDFEIHFSSQARWEQNAQPYEWLLELSGIVNLADLDWAQAAAQINAFTIRHQKEQLTLSGRVNHFVQPDFDLSLQGKNISKRILAGTAWEDETFLIKQFSTQAKGKFLPEQETLQLENFSITLPGVQAHANGQLQFARAAYTVSADLQADLDKLKEGISSTEPYQLAGNVHLKMNTTPTDMTAHMELSEVQVQVPHTGKFSQLQAALDAQERMNFKGGNGVFVAHGELNGEPFQTTLQWTQTVKEIAANWQAKAERLVLPPYSADKKNSKDSSSASSSNSTAQPWSLPPLSIKTNVQIGSLDAPYLRGKDLNFQTDLSGVTPKLDGAHGTFSLALQDGEITDLYQLTDSNRIAKIMFLSLNVVGKVFNSLDVLSVLSGLTNIGKSKDQEGEVIQMIPGEDGVMIPVKVPASKRKVDGRLAYDRFRTDILFDDGVATIETGEFISDMMSFQITGTSDFNTEKLNMTVRAAPGKHEAGGIMPLTLKIGGTVSEPEGNMRLVSSVSSLVTQSVTNNFASRAVKKGIGGIFGLFKKKDQENTETSGEDTAVR